MLRLLKAKARAVVFTAAGVLLALQIVLPTLFDLVVGAMVMGLLWTASRL